MNPLPNGLPRGVQTSEFWSKSIIQLLAAVLDLLVLLGAFHLTQQSENIIIAITTALIPIIEVGYQQVRASSKGVDLPAPAPAPVVVVEPPAPPAASQPVSVPVPPSAAVSPPGPPAP